MKFKGQLTFQIFTIATMVSILFFSCNSEDAVTFSASSDDYKLKVEVVADSTNITMPFAMAFLPDGKMLVTNRTNGKIFQLDVASGEVTKIDNVPETLELGGTGMQDIVVHPNYNETGWIYFSYVEMKEDSLSTMVVGRAKLKEKKLTERQRLFVALPYYKEPNHYGGRLVLKDGYLFITMGERYDLRDSAQILSNHLGKVMRIYDDGRIPTDNPFVNTQNAKPEIWSYGHRNAQGLTLDPVTGELWEHEHGPKGGDEINIIKPGLNYGWPVICHGIDYDGKPIGMGIKEKEGMEQPLCYYLPSIAPSGMEFYTGNVFPKWKNNLFIGAMALTHLNRLVIENNKVVHEERILQELKSRIRCIKQGPDGYLYIGIDGGKILRLKPE
ncbi:MAG: PQQ-dependent sugar dehydrogenase [Chitinophagaceae bacterium]